MLFRKNLIIITLFTLLTACSSNSFSSQNGNKNKCSFIERDLSISWEERSYWCVPKGFKVKRVEIKKQETIKSKKSQLAVQNIVISSEGWKETLQSDPQFRAEQAKLVKK